MHKGEDSEFYLRKGFRVVAIEADPDLIQHCRLRLRDFVERDRLTIVEGAIPDPRASGACPKKVCFFKNNDISAWGTVCSELAERNVRLGTSSRTIEVDPIDFADVLRNFGMPHFMKIDVEGCDMTCVRTLELFRQRPDYLSIESEKTRLANIPEEIDALFGLGYDRFQAIDQSNVPLQCPPNPPSEGAYVPWHFELGSSGLFGAELGGEWKTRRGILQRYRPIRLGYYLLGDDGLTKGWTFRGARTLRGCARRLVPSLTKAAVNGWYDTHARHSGANARD